MGDNDARLPQIGIAPRVRTLLRSLRPTRRTIPRIYIAVDLRRDALVCTERVRGGVSVRAELRVLRPHRAARPRKSSNGRRPHPPLRGEQVVMVVAIPGG